MTAKLREVAILASVLAVVGEAGALTFKDITGKMVRQREQATCLRARR